MATRRADGAISMSDGRVVYGNSLVQAQDLIEILPLVTPPPAWPFVSGGGGGGGSGLQGPSGPAGSAGGAQGNQGLRGVQGFQGDSGPQGAQGSQGITGPGGLTGNQGNVGLQGPQGFQGDAGTGAQGNQGFQGDVGAGTQGAQGAQGFQGNTATGVQGNQGFQGTAGAGGAGAQGNQGFQGADGSGTQGAQGFQGNTGPAGAGNGWTDDGTVVRLTTSTDNVSIGTAAAGGKLFIQGDANEIQLQVRAVVGQTAPIVTFENSGGTDIFNITETGTAVPGVDNNTQVGTASLRWQTMVANQFDVFNAAGDANPVVRMTSSGGIGLVLFGAGAASALDAGLRRVASASLAATDGTGTSDGTFRPISDGSGAVGTNSFRYGSMVSQQFNVFISAGDANPTVSLQTVGGLGLLLFGTGGASAVDTSLRRVAASTLAVADGTGTTDGIFRPLADNNGEVGTASFRYSGMTAMQFSVYQNAGDANPVVRMNNSGALGRIQFGTGGGSAVDTSLVRVAASSLAAADAAGTTDGVFRPLADEQGSVGTASFRYGTMTAVAFNVFNAGGDANPLIRLSNSGALGLLLYGPGGASALDTSLVRQGASSLSPADAAGTTTGDFVPLADNAGNVGTASLRWSLVRAVTITSGDLELESFDKSKAWTIREGTDTLWAINRRNGKKYEIVLDEVDEVEEPAPEDMPRRVA